MVDTLDTTTPRTFHLRYGVFLTDYKTRRYVIATIDAENYPVVFLHERFEEEIEAEIEDEIEDAAVKDNSNDSFNSSFAGRHTPSNLYSLYSVYSLYGADALTLEQANEVLDFLKAGDSRKAITKFKRYFNNDAEPYCEQVGEVVLDDMIPDEWYDAWKEMEFIITSSKDTKGYWEKDVKERGIWD